jgi:hypothetical protein
VQAAEALAEAKREMVRVFEAMPRDLQQTMLSAPRRADLLHSLGAHTKVVFWALGSLLQAARVSHQCCANYSASKCDQHLCPYSRAQRLRKSIIVPAPSSRIRCAALGVS